MFNKFLVAAALVTCFALVSNSAQAQIGPGNYPNHLFAQYTTQGQGGLTAGKYIAPHPVPSHVGHSYRTYEPLMPHEMMYQHSRNYYNYYDAGYKGGGQGMVKTSVRWQAGNNHMGPLPLSTGLSGALYRVKARKYNIPGGSSIGGRLRGGFGCASGTCEAEAYSSDAYLGDHYETEDISGGCAGGCTANAGTNIQR